jgi:gliding motility-associated-like protein
LFVGNYFNNQSDETEIDGDLSIFSGLSNAALITGIGVISFETCTSTGLINNLTPAEYCSSSPLNLLESHCSSTDSEAPEFTFVPENVVYYSDADNCEIVAFWDSPIATDNCSMDEIVGSHSTGEMFQVGTTTITYSATDKAGNESTATFDVIVKDTISPIIKDMPGLISVDASPEICGAIVSWQPPTASDNCSSTLNSDYNPGDLFPIGQTTVTYVAIDPSGNETQKDFQINVKNPNVPVFSGCPEDKIIYADENNCEMEVTWTEPEVSGCGVEIVQTHNPGDLFSIGDHFVKYTATDISGNVATCEFVIQVLDTIAPVFSSCPSEYTIESIDTLNEKSIISWQAPEVSDNCPAVTLTSNYDPGSEFDLGLTEVIYTASDKHGNKTFCRFSVNVNINKPPVLETLILSAEAGELLHICLTAEDPDGDNVFLDSIAYDTDHALIAEVDTSALCFSYSSAIEFDGTDTIKVYIIDDGIFPLRAQAKVLINIKSDRTIKVASVITSNEDGINDKWIISNINFYPGNTVHVFDPFGGLIYQTIGYDNEDIVWEGKNTEGNYVPEGTYFFAISPGNNVEKITGAVEVIR